MAPFDTVIYVGGAGCDPLSLMVSLVSADCLFSLLRSFLLYWGYLGGRFSIALMGESLTSTIGLVSKDDGLTKESELLF